MNRSGIALLHVNLPYFWSVVVSVLNSVAIGFVCDLDEQVYKIAIKTKHRDEHEQMPPLYASGRPPHDLRRFRSLVTKWAWVIFIIDVVFPAIVYYTAVSTDFFMIMAKYHDYMLSYFLSRFSVLTLAQVHLSYCRSRSTMALSEFARRAILFIAVSMLSASITYTLIFALALETNFGASSAVLVFPGISECICGTSGTLQLSSITSRSCVQEPCVVECSICMRSKAPRTAACDRSHDC